MQHPTGRQYMKLVPLEMKELFPDNIQTGHDKERRKNREVQKKTVRISTRKTLRECHNIQQRDKGSQACLSQNSQPFRCSQDISLYPSTCKAPSKYTCRSRRGRNSCENESCESIMNDEHQLEHVDSSKQLCNGTVNIHVPVRVSPTNFTSQMNNQIVPEIQDSGSGLNLRLSYSTQHTGTHTATVNAAKTQQSTCSSKIRETFQNETPEELHIQGEFDSNNVNVVHTSVHIPHDTNDSVPLTRAHIDSTCMQEMTTSNYQDHTCTCSMTNDLCQHDSKLTKRNTDFKQDHTCDGDVVSGIHSGPETLVSDCITHDEIGTTPKAKTSGMSFLNVGDLSDMVASMMSLDCETRENETKDDGTHPVGVSESEATKVGVCARPSVVGGPSESVTRHTCTSVCVPSSSSVFEVTTFKPPSASTPFRYKPHTQSQLHVHQECVNTCTKCTCNSVTHNPEMREKSFVNTCNFDASKSIKHSVHTPIHTGSARSCLAYETPEHLWCSPKLHVRDKVETEIRCRSSDIVDESLTHVNVHELLLNRNETSHMQIQDHTSTYIPPTTWHSSKSTHTTCDPYRTDKMLHVQNVQSVMCNIPTNCSIDHSYNEEQTTSLSIPSAHQFHSSASENFDSDATRLSLDCESFAVYTHVSHNSKQGSVLATETPEHMWTSMKLKAHIKPSVGVCTFENEDINTMSIDGNNVSRIEATALARTSEEVNSFVPFKETQNICQKSTSKDLRHSGVQMQMSILATETPEHLWSSQRVKRTSELNTEADGHSDAYEMSIVDNISKIAPTCTSTFESNVTNEHSTQAQCYSISSKKCDLIPVNAHHTNCMDGDSCTCGSAVAGSTAEEQMLVSQMCASLYVDSSILAQETPEYMWLSPVVKVIGDSFT